MDENEIAAMNLSALESSVESVFFAESGVDEKNISQFDQYLEKTLEVLEANGITDYTPEAVESLRIEIEDKLYKGVETVKKQIDTNVEIKEFNKHRIVTYSLLALFLVFAFKQLKWVGIVLILAFVVVVYKHDIIQNKILKSK